MIWVQKKYARLVNLDGYKERSTGRHFANFRCPYCGDSKRSKKKMRGWFIQKNGNLFFTCYNCDEPSKSLKNFLYDQDKTLYQRYIHEILTETGHQEFQKKIVEESDVFAPKKLDLELQTCDELPEHHKSCYYLNSRGIKREFHKYFYYSENYYEWCKKLQPENFPNDVKSDKRVIIPFKNKLGEIFTTVGRSLENQEPKYLTLRINEDFPKIFGLDRVNNRKTIFVLEGPFDSFFIPNSIAFGGALGNPSQILDWIDIVDKTKIIFIPDNERRNQHTCAFIKKIIEAGFSVFLWPENLDAKDINDLVKKGWSTKDILVMIKKNFYHGMKARIMFADWTKTNRRRR